MQSEIIYRATASAFTIYMILILLRWFSPMLGLDLQSRKLGWIARLTDPLIKQMRRIVPPMGPADFGPVSAVLLVWLVRELSLHMMLSYMTSA